MAAKPTLDEGPVQLPSGRHGLSRAYVVANQRERILDAVALVTARDGYVPMSVDAIVGASGVSRRTFYALYASKQDAYLAACDRIAERLATAVFAVYDTADPLPVRGERCLRAAITFFHDNPNDAQVGIVEVMAAGPAAVEHRDRALAVLAGLVDEAAGEAALHVPPTTAEAVVGGVYAILYRRVRRGEIAGILDLVPDLLFTILVPYLGADGAREAQLASERMARDRPV